MARFLFYLGHPAHYHNVKNAAAELHQRGHEILFVARGKDVLFDLLEGCPFEVQQLPARISGSKIGLVLSVLSREKAMLKICRKFRPDLMAGTDLVITHIGRLLKIPSVIINEDDSAAIPFMARYAFPYATAILAPDCCDQSPANQKKIGYNGYHELAYLRPEYFTPDREQLPPKLRDAKRYFILRFAALTAHHDENKRGIDDSVARKLIRLLSEHGRVFITSERILPAVFEPYRINIHPAKMHHALAFSDLYIGDSQTMAAEAAVLGVPAIRYNDFVGRLSYLKELEQKYKLAIGIPADRPERLFEAVRQMLADTDLKNKWAGRRKEMLEATIDVTAFWVETLETLVKSR